MRGGVNDSRNDEDFEQYEGFAIWSLPWSWQWESGWTVGTYLEANAGVLSGGGDLPLIDNMPGGGGDLPFNDFDQDGDVVGMGDLGLRFFLQIDSWRFKFMDDQKSFSMFIF